MIIEKQVCEANFNYFRNFVFVWPRIVKCRLSTPHLV